MFASRCERVMNAARRKEEAPSCDGASSVKREGLHRKLRRLELCEEVLLRLALRRLQRLLRRFRDGCLAVHAVDLGVPGLGRLDTVLQVTGGLQQASAHLD